MNTFLGSLTIITVATGVATALLTLMIRLGWRRNKDLEDL